MTNIEKARAWIAETDSLAVLTGAGVSAESGVPTYRGNGGLWKTYKAEYLDTPEAFAKDPRLVWEWCDWRRGVIAKTAPNAAHHALAELEKRIPRFTLITQNIDGLHDRAGSRNILKLHGDLWSMKCVSCGATWPDSRAPLPKIPPHCQCGGLARPAIVWYGEALPQGIMKEAEHAASTAAIFMVIGTSAVVYPAAGLVPYAKRAGARVIELNIEETGMSEIADCILRGPAGELLPQLL